MNSKKAVFGWVVYDWANSAFVTTVMAGFFPVFFKEYWSTGADVNMSTALLGLGNSLAGLVVALIAPILGAIADRGQLRKRFLILFAYLGVVMTASLFFIHQGNWPFAIFVYILATIGFSGANIFYDALLPEIADEKRVDYVSGLGYSLGYLGGGLLLLLNVMMTLHPESFGLSHSTQAVQYAFLTVAIWWGGFTVITILLVPEPKCFSSAAVIKRNLFLDGFRQFLLTLKKICQLKRIFLFLLAYWLYIDGVDTVIRMAVDYGISIGFEPKELIAALLITQFVGFPAAILFGKAGQRWSVKGSIYIGIGVYILITLWGAFMNRREEFYILAVLIGLVQGGIQALSRSYYCRLIPKSQAGEFYGFYNMLGKFATIFGPLLIGGVGLFVKWLLLPENPSIPTMEAVTHKASRFGLASLIILFVAGGFVLYFVDEEKGKKEAEAFEKTFI